MNKQRLQEYRSLKHELKHLKGLIEREYNISAVNYNVGSKGSKIGIPTENKAFRIIKLENVYHQTLENLQNKVNEVEDFVSQIPEAITREILRRRYIEGENWVKISMNVGISRRHCIRKHNYYLNEIIEKQS